MDFSSISVSGTTIMVVILLAIIGIRLLIYFYHRKLDKQAMTNLAQLHLKMGDISVLKNRNKYPEADVFRLGTTFFNVALVLSLLITVLAFNWTQYEKEVFIPDDALVMPEDIEIEPPRTDEPPPPPPPPPPPVIEEVPTELITDEEQPEFVDQSVTAEAVVERVEAPKASAAPPPPPPPPPPSKVEEIFKVVEEMPRFPGCKDEPGDAKAKELCAQKKMLEYIYKNIKYPAIARENGVEGNVVITFVVEKDGSITDAKVVRDIGAQCGEEAMRIVNQMPRWDPGKQRGNPVRVQFNLPVRFKLE
jgi:protein TonB